MKVDVVKDYDWTSAPRGSSIRKKAPRVWVKSYKLKSNQLQITLENYINIGKGIGGNTGAKEFYDKMYSDSTIPEDDFNFPFFNDNVRSFSNSFGEAFQDGTGGTGGKLDTYKSVIETAAGRVASIANMARNVNMSNIKSDIMNLDFKGAASEIIKGTGNAPGTYIEKPQFYQYDKSDNGLTVEFVLSNTINDDWQKNATLVKRLTYINRPLRKDSITVDPPRIYSVRVPGHRYIRWAYCESFSVDLMGARRIINNVIVPEAYKISMSFKSLTLEHAGFLEDETNL